MVETNVKIIGIFEVVSDKLNFINLSSKYRVKIDELHREINIEDSTDYIDKFYNKKNKIITDMRIIVGENGVGKTRLLNRIIKYVDKTDKNCTILIDINGKLYRYGELLQIFFEGKKGEQSGQYSIKYNGIKDGLNGNLNDIKIDKTIFFSNAMDYTSNNVNQINKLMNKKVVDISTMSLLTEHGLNRMMADDMYSQILFFIKVSKEEKLNKVIKSYNFNMDKLLIESEFFEKGLYLELNDNSKTFTNLDYILKNLSSENYQSNSDTSIVYCLNKSLFHIFFKESGQIPLKVRAFKDSYENSRGNNDFMEMIQLNDNFTSLDKSRFESLFNEYKMIIKLLKSIDGLDIYASSCEVSLSESKKEIEELLNKNTMEFKDLLTAIKFRWKSISAGEIYFLNLFSRINKIPLKEENYLLIIDEADLGLHPMWQKNWVEIVITLISNMFVNKNIQIVLTTHSPLLLSDFRRRDVTLLERDRKTNEIIMKNCNFDTFGSNVHVNLSDSFFLNDGTIGTFSKNIINDIFKNKNDSKNKKVVSEIGEPIVKEELEKILSSKMLSFTVDEQKEQFDSLLESLKNEVQNLRSLESENNE